MSALPEAPIQKTTVQGIREELRMLWASESMTDDAVIRARTHNLVVYVADDVDAQETTRRVIERTAERPGRVIIIDVDENQKDGLDAWVTTYCHSVNRHQICGEMITLTTSPGHHEELHSAVISLLAPELPVYLWWNGLPDPADHLFAHLAPEAHRILVDSESFADASTGLSRLAELQKTYRLGDLAWARLSPWRQLLAQLWDVRELRGALDTVSALDIHSLPVADLTNPGRSILLLGWLAARLGWSMDAAAAEKTGYAIRWQHAGREGRSALVRSREKSLSPGDIQRIDITAGEGGQAVTARLDLRPDQSSVETSFEAGSRLSMRNSCRFRRTDDGMALAEELDLGYDPSYTSALQAAAHILQLADIQPGKHKHGRSHQAGRS